MAREHFDFREFGHRRMNLNSAVNLAAKERKEHTEKGAHRRHRPTAFPLAGERQNEKPIAQ
jgi:hypothetical protein